MIPNNLILLQTGMTLKDIESIGFNLKHFIALMVLGFLSLLPTLFKGKLEEIDKKAVDVKEKKP